MSIKVAEAHSKNLVGNISSAVPFGYKQTEVGIIPEDWDCKAIGELGDVVRGGSPRPAGDPRYFDGDFIPWLTVASLTNISKSILYVTETASCLTESGSKQSRILQPNTLIISNSGATLGVAKMLGIKCCANDGIAAIINQKFGHKPFLVHFINTKTQELHDTIATGNGQPNLNTALIRNIHVPFPSIEEQTAIANALSDVDALIQELEKLIAKKQAIKTATMQQLLTGRTRLPQFDHHPDGRKKGYKPSELGEIPEDWEVGVLGEVCDFENGDRSSNYPAANEFSAVGIPFINAGHVSEGLIDSKNMDYIPRFVFDRLGGGKVKSGDLVYCLRGSLGKFGVINDSFGLGAVASSLVIVRPNKLKTSTRYLTTYFKSEIAKKMISLWAGGAAQPNLGAKELAKFSILLPEREEQIAISSIFTDMDEEVLQLEQRLNKTRQIKQGMMQELLTGKTRLMS